MSDPGLPLAQAHVGKRRFSIIWLIPIVTVVIAGWLVWDSYSKRGPVITITMDAAQGLVAGQSQVKHRDVGLGTIKSIVLTKDMNHVLVTVAMSKEATPLLTDGARFWVVKPRFFAGSLSGLGTLLSGSYLEMLPSQGGSTKPRTSFVALTEPPVLQSDEPGHTFTLKADRIGSVTVGSPIFFRDLEVGTVLGWDVTDMARSVTIRAFVRAPYDAYVHNGSQFWNASGLAINVGAEGVKVQVQSLTALLLGGIAFETADEVLDTPSSANAQEFPLYDNEEAAVRAGYSRHVVLESFFTGSVAGLAAGAPVTFQGLRIGEVTDVSLEYDPVTDTIRAPVHYIIYPEKIANVRFVQARGPLDNLKILVARGMRAQLESANLLTGQQLLSLDIQPNAVPAEVKLDGATFVVPSVPGTFAGLKDAASQLLAKLSAMPFAEIGDNLNGVLKGANGLTNDPALKQAVGSLSSTLVDAQTLVKRLNAGVSPALRQLPTLVATLQMTLGHASSLLTSVDNGYGNDSRFSRQVDQLMVQFNAMAQSLKSLADLLNRHPEALIRGRTNTGIQ